MKSIAMLALGALVAVTVMLTFPHATPHVGYAGSPLCNGDVNGDGRVDIADGIYIINYQLRQGPPPVPIEPRPCLATGQTCCYDNDGNVIDCVSTEYPGQDAFYRTGSSVVGRFVANGDGTVTDNCTGLMWQKDTAPGTYTWQSALNYCENLKLAGHTDWRLPNLRELQSLADYSRVNPSMDPIFGEASKYYLSSSTYVDDPDNAWYMFFGNGYLYFVSKDFDYYVRAVRGEF